MVRLNYAIIFAAQAHDGQLDKIGQPVILHPLRVMNAVALAHPHNEDAQIVAVLHDVVEDTPVTLDDIEHLFGKTVRDGVDSVSRRIVEIPPDEPIKERYRDFVKRAKANEIGRIVKVADLNDNLTRPHPPGDGAKRRYYEALAELASGY